MKQLDQDTIEFTGDSYSILKIYDLIMGCEEIGPECDKTREEIANSMKLIEDPLDRFIRENGCNMTKDISSVTVRFHRNRK